MQRQVQLIRGDNNTSVNAYLVGLQQKHIDDYKTLWRNQLILHLQSDKFVDWEFKLRFISNSLNREGSAIEELSGETQGLMLIETQLHGSRITEGQRLVYMEIVATAPWNRTDIQYLPRYKSVGTIFIQFARTRSIELGYQGRLGLHSLPGTEKFYDNQRMLNLGADEDYENIVYFEYGIWRSYQKSTEN